MNPEKSPICREEMMGKDTGNHVDECNSACACNVRRMRGSKIVFCRSLMQRV